MRSSEFLLDILNDTMNKYITTDEELQKTGGRLNEVIIENSLKDKEIESLKERVEFLEIKNSTLLLQIDQLDTKHDEQLDELRYEAQAAERKVLTQEGLLKEAQHKLSEAMNSSANWRVECEKWREAFIEVTKERNELRRKAANGSGYPVDESTDIDISSIGEVTEQSLPKLDNTPTVVEWIADDAEC